MTAPVVVRPAQAGLVELQVGPSVALLTADECRAVVAELLVQADRAEGLVAPPLDLGEGG